MADDMDERGSATMIEEVRKSLAERLSELIRAQGTNERAVADQAGLGPTYVRDITHGKVKSPTLAKLKRVADVLGVSVEYLSHGGDVAVSTPVRNRMTPEPLSTEVNKPRFLIDGGLVHIEATLDREGAERLREQIDGILALMD